MYILQYTEGVFIRIHNGSAVVLVPIVVFIGMFFKQYIGTAFGLFVGILMDINTNGFFCFNAIILMLFGCFSWLLVTCYLNKNFLTAVILDIVFSFLYFTIKWGAMIIFNGADGYAGHYAIYSVPSALYTAALGLPIYFLFNWFTNKISYKK